MKMFDVSTIVMIVLAAGTFLALTLVSGVGTALEGSRTGMQFFLSTIPRLFFAFMFAGTLQVLLPRGLITQWLSDTAGMRGLVIASLAGALTPGGPFLQFPIVAAVYKMGAGIAPIVAYLTAWSLLGVHRVFLWELPFLGPRLTLTRLVVSAPIPLAAGVATRWALSKL